MAALDGDQSCVGEMTRAYEERSRFIVGALNDVSGFECRPGEGAFYAFPKVTEAMARRGFKTDGELVEYLVNEADVVAVPGSPFAAPGYLRISFACSLAELQDAAERIRKALA